MNSSGNSILGTPAPVKEDMIREVDRTVVDVKLVGDAHVAISFAGADGKVREALAKNDRILPATGDTARFRAYRNTEGRVRWAYAFTVNTESAESAAQA